MLLQSFVLKFCIIPKGCLFKMWLRGSGPFWRDQGWRNGKSFHIYLTKDLYDLEGNHSNFSPVKWWVLKGPMARWLKRCQCIWKSHSSFKHKVWRWLLLHQGLAVKSRLHKVGGTNTACTVCGKDEMIKHVFLQMLPCQNFLGMFHCIALLEWSSLGGHLHDSGQLQFFFCTHFA